MSPSLLLLLLQFSSLVLSKFDLPFFPPGSPWTYDISSSNDIHPQSSQILQWLTDRGGWGFGGRFHIDRSINVLKANIETPKLPFSKKSGYFNGACDDLTYFPVPLNGALEGNESWKSPCIGDCHLIVFDEDTKLLWESWDTDVTLDNNKHPISVESTCAVVWNTSYLYPSSGRGEGCTSADAAGFPIASLLFTPDEIMNRSINHAIRFILPNNRIRKGYYIHPASHYGGPSSLSSLSVVYGSRFRLKSNFDVSGYSIQARVVLNALKKYGMYLSDGGNIALTAQSDWHNTQYSWDDVGLGVRDLYGVTPNDFEIMNGWGNNPLKGPYNGWPDCIRNNIPIDLNIQTKEPTIVDESMSPTLNPTKNPSIQTPNPTNNPSLNPIIQPTINPSKYPTNKPITNQPTICCIHKKSFPEVESQCLSINDKILCRSSLDKKCKWCNGCNRSELCSNNQNSPLPTKNPINEPQITECCINKRAFPDSFNECNALNTAVSCRSTFEDKRCKWCTSNCNRNYLCQN